jgi:hypothetical protein
MSAPKIAVAMIAAPCAPSECHGVEIGHARRPTGIDRETRACAIQGTRYSWPGRVLGAARSGAIFGGVGRSQ